MCDKRGGLLLRVAANNFAAAMVNTFAATLWQFVSSTGVVTSLEMGEGLYFMGEGLHFMGEGSSLVQHAPQPARTLTPHTLTTPPSTPPQHNTSTIATPPPYMRAAKTKKTNSVSFLETFASLMMYVSVVCACANVSVFDVCTFSL